MIIEDNFIKFKTELSNAVVAFEKKDGVYYLYFNNHCGFQEFKNHINQLYYEFINEVRNNLVNLMTNDEIQIYLEMLLHVFEILDEQIGAYPDFVTSHRNVKMVSQSNAKMSCIHTSSDDLSQMLAYFQYQKKIIHKSTKFILIFLKKCKRSDVQSKPSVQSWKDELKDFYSEMMKLKDGVNRIDSISEKIKYLQNERISLSEEFEKKGKDIYSSPLNLFFESHIESLKDFSLLVAKPELVPSSELDRKPLKIIFLELLTSLEKINSKRSLDQIRVALGSEIKKLKSFCNGDITDTYESSDSSQLKWTESKAALVELIYALYSSDSINKGRAEIKEITKLFEILFNVQLGDVYHTFLEVRSRKIERTKFLDYLKESLIRRMEEADEK